MDMDQDRELVLYHSATVQEFGQKGDLVVQWIWPDLGQVQPTVKWMWSRFGPSRPGRQVLLC